MHPNEKLGIVAFLLTLVLMIPILFILSRGTVNTNQFILIVSGVLLLVLWTIPYATLVDPSLRRGVGALFNVTIEWRGTSKSMSWTPVQETGFLAGLFIDLLGYLFIILWFTPFAAALGLVLWLRD
jgi:hypothetical protein